MKVKRSDTIENLKAMIHEKEGILEDLQELYSVGNRLGEDDLRVMDYDIPKNSTINLVHQESSHQMKIYFKVPSDEEKFELEVKKSDSIETFKTIIHGKRGIHPSEYAVYCAGKQLENFRTVASLKIPSEASLEMISTPKEMLSVFVETLTGETIEVEVTVAYTILDVKKIVESMTNVTAQDFEVFFWNREASELINFG